MTIWRRRRSESDDGGEAVGLPLASAPSGIGLVLGFVGHCLMAANIDLRAPACPSFIWRCVKGGRQPRMAGAADQGAGLMGFMRIGFL
jgi:hypothetical protein